MTFLCRPPHIRQTPHAEPSKLGLSGLPRQQYLPAAINLVEDVEGQDGLFHCSSPNKRARPVLNLNEKRHLRFQPGGGLLRSGNLLALLTSVPRAACELNYHRRRHPVGGAQRHEPRLRCHFVTYYAEPSSVRGPAPPPRCSRSRRRLPCSSRQHRPHQRLHRLRVSACRRAVPGRRP